MDKEKKIKPALTQQIGDFVKDTIASIKKVTKELIDKFNSLSKKGKIITIASSVSVIIIIVLSCVIYHAQYGYLKPYEKEYGVTYPKGIQEELCDAYGKDITVRGEIVLPDTKQKRLVSKAKSLNNAYLQRGSTIDVPQQFSSIRISSDFDLEKTYSTPKGFLKSSQKIVFNTLYEKREYQVIACFYTNTIGDSKDRYVYPYNLYGDMTQRSFAQWQDKLQSRRLYDTGYNFNYYDKFLSVAVDSDFMNNYAFVVVCVQTDGKIQKSKTAKENKNVHYPQSYYEKNKLDGQYTFAPKWYPEIYIEDEPVQLVDRSFIE